MMRIKKWWRKHPKCKEEYCKTGLVGDYYEYDGSSGIKWECCSSCYKLWLKDFEEIKKKARKRMYKIPSPDEIVRYVLRNKSKLRVVKR